MIWSRAELAIQQATSNWNCSTQKKAKIKKTLNKRKHYVETNSNLHTLRNIWTKKKQPTKPSMHIINYTILCTNTRVCARAWFGDNKNPMAKRCVWLQTINILNIFFFYLRWKTETEAEVIANVLTCANVFFFIRQRLRAFFSSALCQGIATNTTNVNQERIKKKIRRHRK